MPLTVAASPGIRESLSTSESHLPANNPMLTASNDDSRFHRGRPNVIGNDSSINAIAIGSGPRSSEASELLPSRERSFELRSYPVAITRAQSDVTNSLMTVKYDQIYEVTLLEYVVQFGTAINSSGQNGTEWAQGAAFGQSPLTPVCSMSHMMCNNY